MDSSIHILLTCIYDYSGHLLLVSRFFATFRMTVPAGVWLGGFSFQTYPQPYRSAPSWGRSLRYVLRCGAIRAGLHGGGQFWNFSEKPACIVYDGVDQEVVENMP